MVAVVEDVLYSATGIPLWKTWRFHPVSIFAGVLAFGLLLYLLQRINDRARAMEYVEPFMPLLALSGANLLLDVNSAWLLPVLLASVFWSIGRMRKARSHRAVSRRASSL